MLGKQVRKLQTEAHSLVTRLFKARYFTSSNYFNAKLGHNPSYVWCSILRARFIVRRGARWCIDLGNSIPILNETWFKNCNCIASNSTETNFLHNFIAASLIDTDAKQWSSNLIHQLFSNVQAADILNTPLVPHIPAERLIWKVEKNCMYSVKNVYRLCVQELIDISYLRRPGNLECHMEVKGTAKN